MAKKAYRCNDCGSEKVLEDSVNVPACCGSPMQEIKLENCTHPFTAESANFRQVDDACDDGVH